MMRFRRFKSTFHVKDIAENLDTLSLSIKNDQHFYQNSILFDYVTNNQPHPVTLRQLAGFGKKLSKEKILSSLNFVRLELPIRLGLRIKELQTKMPYEVVSNYHISQIYDSYYNCFNLFRKYKKIETLEDNEEFLIFCKQMLDDHLLVLPHLMMGALEISISQSLTQQQLDEFMSQMLRSRISRRVILEEHLSLSKNFLESPDHSRPVDYIGDLFHQCSAVEHLQLCGTATQQYLQTLYPHLKMPELIINTETDFKFPFMISHLHYIFGEIFRNCYKSTIDNFIKQNSHLSELQLSELQPPPVIISIVENSSDFIFRFSDQGGGIKKESLEKIWCFGKTPELAREYLLNFHRLPGLDISPIVQKSPLFNKLADSKYNSETFKYGEGEHSLLAPTPIETGRNTGSTLAKLITRPFQSKLGISLPICKVYVDYWNGELEMHSLDGYGSDTYIRLSKLGADNAAINLDRA